MLTKEQYDKLAPFKIAMKMYVESTMNVGMDLKKIHSIYKDIVPGDRIDMWCSGCIDIMLRRSYDLLIEYEDAST